MAEFSKAMEVEPGAYCEQVAGALRGAARVEWKRGNKFFLAKQHAYFLLAYGECKCVEHSCTGCALTLKVAILKVTISGSCGCSAYAPPLSCTLNWIAA